jgi:[ribosomal protein S5]-alanine N-acetyltransferase
MKPILQTKRLQLVPFDLNDLKWLHNIFTHPFVRQYLWDDKIITLEQAKEILVVNEQNFNTYSWGLWKIRIMEEDTYAGFTGLWFFFGESQPQLLYGLLPEHIRKGYATEASGEIIRYAFDELRFDYLVAACDVPNLASKQVCKRLRMLQVENSKIDGRPTTFFRIEKANSISLK